MLYLELEITEISAVAVIIESFLNKRHSQYDVDNNDADLLTENVYRVPAHAMPLFQWFLISFVVQRDDLLLYLCHMLLL